MDNEKNKFYKNLLIENINFKNGYSLSKNWIGYFECNKIKLNAKHTLKAIKSFTEYFSNYLDKLIILTSLFKDTVYNKSDDIKIKNPERELFEKNYIKAVSLSADQNEWEKQYADIILNFTIKNSNKNVVEKISYLVMEDNHIHGHCFFILEKSDLIIYAHEDKGYGFIGIKDKNNKMAIDFLEKTGNEFSKYFWWDYKK
jgi:hypothetical protein